MKFRLLLTVILGILFICVTQTKAQWVKTSTPPSPFITSLAVTPNGAGGTNLFIGIWRSGVYKSTDNGTSWTEAYAGMSYTGYNVHTFAVSPEGKDSTNLFAGTEHSVYLSTDNGTSWADFDTVLSHALLDVVSLAIIPNGTGGINLLAGTDNNFGALLSTDRGTSWSAVNNGLTPNNTGTHSVLALAVTPNGAGGTNLFAGTDGGGGVYRSTNNGTSWTEVDSGLTNTYYGIFGTPTVNIFTITSGTGGTNIFAGTSGDGVFRSTNNGTSWSQVNTGLADSEITAFAVSPNGAGGTNIFAGTYSGVFLSTNNGTNWTAVNTGFTEDSVTALAIGPNGAGGTNLFAATWYGGVWRRPLSEMITGVKEEQNNLPSNFALEQNYPNPFNPTTTINYSVPKTSLVSIKVYDVLGREIETLVNEQKNPGNYKVTVNAGKLASGVYFYQLRSSDYTSIKKMLLLK
ncbi:MAG: T9SS type A sorting domain-containing protein [Ignavibacteriaceae bacterium]